MARKRYDVFISYRHTGGVDFARSIALYLRAKGYLCFFDQSELKTGQFNQQIFEAIENSKYFIAVLTADSLKRCANPKDWVRREMEHAFEVGTPVVPVRADRQDLVFPADLPESLARLETAQASFIDRENAFEDTVAKMLRDQLPDLCGMTNAQHRRMKRQAEKVFLAKAARFKDNDGVIDAAERAELERLANTIGISRTRLEELIEMVEAKSSGTASPARRFSLAFRSFARAVAAVLFLLLLAFLAVVIWGVVSQRPDPAAEEPGEAVPPRVEPPVTPGKNLTPVAKEEPGGRLDDLDLDALLSGVDPTVPATMSGGDGVPDSPRETRPAAPRKPPAKSNEAEGGAAAASAKPAKASSNGQASALAKLGLKWREYAEADFRNSLKAKSSPKPPPGSVAEQIVKEYEKAAAEGRKLHRLGMHPKELISTRPDLVLKFAELRSKVRGEIKQLIKDGKMEEALRYYNSAQSTFAALGMQPLSRPSFSTGNQGKSP